MRVLVVGAGAVGGYFGGSLAREGVDVEFLARPQQAQELSRRGMVTVSSTGHRMTDRVETVTADRLGPGWDLILLAVKARALNNALDDIEAAVSDATAILPFLNGVGHIETIANQFGIRHVLGGVATIASELNSSGEITLLAPGGSAAFGELDGRMSDRVARIATMFERTAINVSTSTTIVQDMWEKWLFMAAGGAVTTLLGAPIGEVVDVPGGPAITEQIVSEVSSVLHAEGHAPRPQALSRVLSTLTEAGSSFTTSLYRDVVAGRHTEAETILGGISLLAQNHRIETPITDTAVARLRIFERRLSLTKRNESTEH